MYLTNRISTKPNHRVPYCYLGAGRCISGRAAGSYHVGSTRRGPYPPFSLRVTDEGYRVVELEGLVKAGLDGGRIQLQLAVIPRTTAKSLSIRFTALCRSPEGELAEASFTDRLSTVITQ